MWNLLKALKKKRRKFLLISTPTGKTCAAIRYSSIETVQKYSPGVDRYGIKLSYDKGATEFEFASYEAREETFYDILWQLNHLSRD